MEIDQASLIFSKKIHCIKYARFLSHILMKLGVIQRGHTFGLMATKDYVEREQARHES